MIQQWAFSWQERASDLKSFSVPVFRFNLFFIWIKVGVFLHLHNEPNLGWVAEVRYSQVTNLVDEGFSGQLKFILSFFNQILKLEGLELHDISNT